MKSDPKIPRSCRSILGRMRTLLLASATLLAAHLAVAQAPPDPFLAAGIPAVSRAWSGPDYQRAAAVLAAGKVPLPRLSDPQGAALLGRMTSLENLALERDPKLSLQARLEDFIPLQQGASSLLKQYLAAGARGGFRPETARLAAFLVRSSALGLELVTEMIPTVPKDEKYATRMAGVKQMNDGMTSVFVGCEQMLTPSNHFAPEDLSILLAAMAETLPRVKKTFSADFSVELRRKLEADRPRFKAPEDVRRIDAMIAALAAP
jgi:hypothetical protein